MTTIHLNCPWCHTDIALKPKDVQLKVGKKKLRGIEIIQLVCPSCNRNIQLSRQRLPDGQKQ